MISGGTKAEKYLVTKALTSQKYLYEVEKQAQTRSRATQANNGTPPVDAMLPESFGISRSVVYEVLMEVCGCLKMEEAVVADVRDEL
ncbi:MAG: hypothetical protein OQK35_08825 [Alphaproteobacteria bacterium]|nr:hypothetical protein [Rhodospirillales bacterium]MCW9046423.1 hypothetical protein [Alphaproteobacteria bacterium]